MEEVIIDGRKYVSAKQAAEITKYSQDYIGQLVRAGTLPGRLIGRTRFVEEEALLKYSRVAKFHNQNLSELKEPALPPEEQKTEESTQPKAEESKVSDYVFNGPTGYSHGWQSRSRFDQVTEVGIKIENVQENFLKKLFSRIKNNLPRNTAFISMLLVVSGVFVLFSSNEINNRLAYISTAKTETPVNQKINQIAAVADIGILNDITSNIKKAIDGLALRTYKNISASGNRLISFVSDLFGGAGQNFFALFNKNKNKDAAPETVAVDSYAPKSAPVKITQSNQIETKEQPTKVSATESPRIIERIIERVVERVPATVITADVDSKLEQLKNKVFSEIYKVADGLSTKTNTVYQAVSLTNKIDNLNKVTISDATITGSTYSGSVSGTSGSFSGSLSANGGFSATAGTFSGNLTVTGTPTFYGALTLPYFTATSTTATSTFAGQSLFSYVPSIVHTFGAWSPGVSGSNPLTASVMINPASATADSNLLSISVNNSAKFLIDAEGDVFANSITASGGVTLSTTTASTFSVENNTTLGDSITDTTTINGTLIVTGTTTASTVAGKFGVGTTSPYAALSVVGEAVSAYFTATTTNNNTFPNLLATNSTTTNATTTNLFSTTASSTNLFTSNFSLGSLTGFLKATAGSVATALVNLTTDITGILGVSNGGTGVSALQSGYIPFGQGTSAIATSSSLYFDSVNGKLGLGTTSPYAKLSVVGEAVAEYFTATSTTATSTFAGGLSAAGSSGLTVLQSGNVGIGTTGPGFPLDVQKSSTPQANFSGWSTTGNAASSNAGDILIGSATFGTRIQFTPSTGGDNIRRTYIDNTYDDATAETRFRMRTSGTAVNAMTILGSGNVGIGTASPGYKLEVSGNLGVNTIYVAAANKIFQSRNDATLEYAQEYSRNGSRIGGIYLDSSTVQYITSSDVRLKDNIQDLQGAISLVRSIKPRTFRWKATGLNDIGFVAQEIETVFPSAVTKTTNPDDLKGVDYGRITPLLAGAINNITSVIDLANATTTFASIYIDGAGNVGIGTTTPAYKLHVLGDVAAQSFVNISTRDSKKDISYLSVADNETALEKLKNLFVARYRYEAEDASAPLRTGLIAEEAPEEVLAAGGKGVDLYKFVSFLTSGVKALVAKIDAVIAKVASFADVFMTQKLCVGNTCVTETELQALLAGVGSSGSSATTADMTTTSTATTTTDSTTVATTTSTTTTSTATTTETTTGI